MLKISEGTLSALQHAHRHIFVVRLTEFLMAELGVDLSDDYVEAYVARGFDRGFRTEEEIAQFVLLVVVLKLNGQDSPEVWLDIHLDDRFVPAPDRLEHALESATSNLGVSQASLGSVR